MNKPKLYIAPLQGLTEYPFRNLLYKHFGFFDKAFAPFVRFDADKKMKKSQEADLLPANNAIRMLVPQVLTNRSDELLYFADYSRDKGYGEINWNLGCPFSMVTKRKLGSGLLAYPEEIEKILENYFQDSTIQLSVKLRLGYNSNEEICPVLKVLNKYPLVELIIHPRIGKQMYSGEVDLEAFARVLNQTRHSVCYNGDIKTYHDFCLMNEKFQAISCWMIGRAAVSNPMIIREIATGERGTESDMFERFSMFHLELFETYTKVLSGPGHILQKMQQFWEYFSLMFDNPHKTFKQVKKSQSILKYQNVVYELFNHEMLKNH
jgi:tRNA-dihydrouridine synthase B